MVTMPQTIADFFAAVDAAQAAFAAIPQAPPVQGQVTPDNGLNEAFYAQMNSQVAALAATVAEVRREFGA